MVGVVKSTFIHSFILLTFASGEFRRLIIDGSVATDSSDPYAVTMMYCHVSSDGSPYVCGLMCSGSLITPNVVLTAAHCIRSYSAPFEDPTLEIEFANTFVLLGSSDYDKLDWSQNSRIVRVKNAVHHGFGDNIRFPFDGDMAVLELEECVTTVPNLIETIKVGTRASDSNVGTCSTIRAVGYGMISNAPDPLNDSDGKRRFITDFVNSYGSCRDSFIAASMGWLTANEGSAPREMIDTVLSDSILCAGGSSVHSVCYGDSGGPSVVRLPGSDGLQVVGATSFGFGAVCTLSPDFSTRVSFHASWIRQTLEGGLFSQCPGWNIQDSFATWPVEPIPEAELSDDLKRSRCTPLDGSRWQCQSGTCLDITKVCDGHVDCDDGSDEVPSYCSYVQARSKGNRRLSTGGTGHAELLEELDGLIGSRSDAQPVLKLSLTAKQPEPSNRSQVKIAGILKSRALRLKADTVFFDSQSLTVPAGKSRVDCTTGLTVVTTEKQRAEAANTIDDQWDANPLSNACTDLLTCTGGSASSIALSDERKFCTEFLGYLEANATLTDYASNFKERFNAYCPGDGGQTSSDGSTTTSTTTNDADTLHGSFWVIAIISLLMIVH